MVSIVIPSRGRPAKLARVIESIHQTTKGLDVEIIAVLDIPDARSHKLTEAMTDVHVVTMPSHYKIGNSMRKWQSGYEIVSHEWVVLCSDDIVYDDGWLEAALNHDDPSVEVQGFVGLWDPRNGDMIASMFMATKTYIETYMDGHFGLPWYYAAWADNEWTCKAAMNGARTFCQKASFTHLNYALLGEEPDEVGRAAHSRHSLDQATFYARVAAGFPSDWPEVW